MDGFFTEKWTNDVRFSIRIKEKLFSKQTKFQKMEFFVSEELGRFFTLDDVLMATEKDEFIYHEMMIHTPLAVHPKVEKVLVIGGGDGGSVRELVKYHEIQSIDMVEIDEEVVLACEKYFPQTSSSLRNPKVHLRFEDGLAFVKATKTGIYDLIVVDSTDPIGVGEGLFSKDFYLHCHRILKDDGILVNQHESPYFENTRKEMIRAHQKIQALFPVSTIYQAFIPTYPSGHWLFGFASKKYLPTANLHTEKLAENHIFTNYYNHELHQASFVLPNYVKALLESEGK